MKYSCAVIFYSDGKVLLGHTTGQNHWDLPKGKAEAGETYAEAATRECKEETGFDIHPDDLFLIGEVDYQKNKKLVLFYYTPPSKPNASTMVCRSTYTTRHGKERPELDKFKYVSIDDFDMYLTERMCNSIKTAIIVNKNKWTSK